MYSAFKNCCRTAEIWSVLSFLGWNFRSKIDFSNFFECLMKRQIHTIRRAERRRRKNCCDFDLDLGILTHWRPCCEWQAVHRCELYAKPHALDGSSDMRVASDILADVLEQADYISKCLRSKWPHVEVRDSKYHQYQLKEVVCRFGSSAKHFTSVNLKKFVVLRKIVRRKLLNLSQKIGVFEVDYWVFLALSVRTLWTY